MKTTRTESAASDAVELHRQIVRLKTKRRKVELAIFALEGLSQAYRSAGVSAVRNRWILVLPTRTSDMTCGPREAGRAQPA